MAAWKLAPALAAGDAIVIKPSSTTSLSLLELMKLIENVVPKGVINLITGSGSKSGEYLLQNDRLSKLAFTGSTEIGYEVAKAAADKPVSYTHLRAHETGRNLVCRLLLEKKKTS